TSHQSPGFAFPDTTRRRGIFQKEAKWRKGRGFNSVLPCIGTTMQVIHKILLDNKVRRSPPIPCAR
ncbi:hypothetical protein Tsubulata_016564, partial [Turnera subulata]